MLNSKRIILLISTVIFVALIFYVNSYESDYIGDGVEYSGQKLIYIKSDNVNENQGLLLNDLIHTPELQGYIYTYEINRIGKVGNDINETGCEVTGTNYLYPSFYSMNFLKGSFFTSNIQHKNVVCISNELAYSLFKDLDVIGKVININEERFIITGIYEQDSNSVYIPLKSFNKLFGALTFDTLAFASLENQENYYSIRQLDVILELDDYYLFEYGTLATILSKIDEFMKFILGLIIIYYLVKILKYILYNFIEDFKLKHKENYFFGVFKANPIWGLKYFMLITLSGLFIMLVFRIVSFVPYIPIHWIPVNIYDLESIKILVEKYYETTSNRQIERELLRITYYHLFFILPVFLVNLLTFQYAVKQNLQSNLKI